VSLGKYFLIKSYDVASECITFFDCSVSDAIYKRKLKFLTTALRKHYLQTVWKIYRWRTGYCTQTFCL